MCLCVASSLVVIYVWALSTSAHVYDKTNLKQLVNH